MGSLVSDMRLESAAFQRDLGAVTRAINSQTAQQRRAMQRVEQAARRVQRQFSQLRGAVAALAGAFAVRQFAKFAQAAIDTGDAIEKQSKQLQISTAAFQRFSIEGELAGVTTEKLGSGLGAFTKRVGELRAGTGTLITILDKSNKALKNQLLAAGSTEEGFRIMLDAINNAGSAFDKQALSAAAFGRQAGQAMVLLAEEAGKLDPRMVALVTRSDEMIEASKDLGDQMTRLKRAFSAGFDTKIIEGLVGSIDKSVDAMVESMTEARRIGEEFGQAVGAAMRGVAAAVKFVGHNMREIVAVAGALIALKLAGVVIAMARAFLTLALAMKAAAVSGGLLAAVSAGAKKGLIGLVAAAAAFAAIMVNIEAVDASITDALQAFGTLTSGADDATEAFEKTKNALDSTTSSLAQQFSEVNSLRLATEQGADAVRRHTIELETHKALIDSKLIPATQTLIETQKLLSKTGDERVLSILAIVEATERQRNAVKSLTEAESLLKSVQTGHEERVELQQRLNELVEQGALTQAQATMIWLRTLERTKRTMSDVGNETRRAKDFARDFGLTMSSAFEDAIVSGNGLRDILRGLEQDILRILTRSIITEPAGNLFSDFIGKAVGSLGSFFGGAPMTPSGFVQGGGSAFASGGSFMVGGAGGTDSQPVNFWATPGERVTIETPGQQARGGVQVTIINNAGAEVGVRESSTTGGGVSLEVTLDKAVARQVRRPGSDTAAALSETFGARRALALR
jgi:hypothetical protein